MSTPNDAFDPYAQWLGLNLREQPLDHYLLLGLERYEADRALIERQTDERMRLVRSFQTGPRGRYTQKLMNELAAAKLCLLSPAAKQVYDRQLELWTQGAAHPSVVEPGEPAESTKDEEVAELPPAAQSAWSPTLLSPPVAELAAPPIASVAPQPTEEEAQSDEDASQLSVPLVVVGLVLGMIGVGIAGWMLTSYAMHQGWIAGGPPQGGPPAAMAAKSPHQSAPPNFASIDYPVDEGISPVAEGDETIEVLQEGSGDVFLSPATANVSGNVDMELDGTEDVLAGWQNGADVASWRFRLIQPGFFEVQILYAAGDAAFGRKLNLNIDGQTQSFELQPTTDGYRTDLQVIAMPKSGSHELHMAQAGEFDGGLRVKLVRLRAIASSGK